MTSLPREMQPDPALEGRIVATLLATGLIRRRRVWPRWVAAAALLVMVAVGARTFRPAQRLAPGRKYVVLLYEDSTYRPAPGGDNAERRAVLGRWADSLEALGQFERAGRVLGPGPLGGLFIVRAPDDSAAARIAASCPFHQWGGRVEIERFEP